MEYKNCPLYRIYSKKQLCLLLKIKNPKLLKQDYVSSLISPYIDITGKPRLIEPPQDELKIVQKRIKYALGKIDVPENVFSGVKGRSYTGNAIFHIGDKLRYVYKIDLTAFFPSISRDVVYKFFRNDMECSADVSNILTNLTTVDLCRTVIYDKNAVYEFLDQKKIKCTNHLISGAPTSQILSYLVNHRMFDEMQSLSVKNHVTMTIYVDDITFSCENKISNHFKKQIQQIVKKHYYIISNKKVKYYTKHSPKLVTGVVISADGKLVIKNSLRKDIVYEHEYLRKNPNSIESRKRLKGLLTAARQVQKDAFPTIFQFAFSKEKDLENNKK